MIHRVYVEKKSDYAVRASELKEELEKYLGIQPAAVRALVRYDIENLSDETYQKAKTTVFSEPPVDNLYEEEFPHAEEDYCFTVEYLPGQFDQRADSAMQCVCLLAPEEKPLIRTATTYVITPQPGGEGLTEQEKQSIITHCVNPVDSRITDAPKPDTLEEHYDEPADVPVLDGFRELESDGLETLYGQLGLAMTLDDLRHIQRYFREEEQRDPTMTEIRVLDTYWSDHCRHTTFATELTGIHFDEGHYRPLIEDTFRQYLADHHDQYEGRDDKYVCLMDIGTLAAKRLRKMGLLEDQEVSDEINACSIVVPVQMDGQEEEWLVNFKNETHNHPTEIEPFGGAATCLGGCIRDPLSGRTYVYQAMRITGAADPTAPLESTLPGKLPQRKITTTAARGYSSYGNQIGLATGLVNEVYHPGYVAKRMEIGAVVAAAPRRQVQRLSSDPGDVVILLGGRTGRDGIGGATGASKSHTTASLTTCGAEVQKGNAPTERKIQRLFRREEVSRLIKKCNDFGAGGVSVAIGELADGLRIDLDKVPKKYAGLDGTELAISESQERMAVVVASADADQMLRYADEENLEAVVVASVTEEPRMVITWRGKEVVNLSRRFIDTNGAHQQRTVSVAMPGPMSQPCSTVPTDVKDRWLANLADLNVCSQKGLVEMFDSTVGAGSVWMPYGGRTQTTPTQGMVGLLPTLTAQCDTVTIMSHGLDPYLSSWSPFHGAAYAVVDSVAKVVAAGGSVGRIRLTFQEYFPKLGQDPYRWGLPFASLLGAYHAQMGLQLPAIGGKDSMSGTFNDIDVPPTLCSFALGIGNQKYTLTPELKKAGHYLYLLEVKPDANDMPNYRLLRLMYRTLHHAIRQGVVKSAYAVGFGGIAEAVSKMAFGNRLGVCFDGRFPVDELFQKKYGALVVEVEHCGALPAIARLIGRITEEPEFVLGDVPIGMDEMLRAWTGTLEEVFPTQSSPNNETESLKAHVGLKDFKDVYLCRHKVARPQVFIPAFPGTNCEYDSARAFLRAGAEVQTLVFRNLSASHIQQSVEAFAKAIDDSQMVMIPGGFSAGDEPDGSAKFITSVFRNPQIGEAVMRLLRERDGLMLGICNGFQALVKLGLVPYGEIRPQTSDAPTLTFNTIRRHQSMMALTRVSSNLSPWLRQAELGKVYTVPVSHGEGRFVAPQSCIDQLFANGQVATQYVDLQGNPTMQEPYNMNGSYCAIEGITSPDGRVLGKMAHSERRRTGTYQNVPGEYDQRIFESGVAYFAS